jgi:hypothetical protein
MVGAIYDAMDEDVLHDCMGRQWDGNLCDAVALDHRIVDVGNEEMNTEFNI